MQVPVSHVRLITLGPSSELFLQLVTGEIDKRVKALTLTQRQPCLSILSGDSGVSWRRRRSGKFNVVLPREETAPPFSTGSCVLKLSATLGVFCGDSAERISLGFSAGAMQKAGTPVLLSSGQPRRVLVKRTQVQHDGNYKF
ncbi:hypothetical protein F441_04147 [Phytophthora nicotianae CJ01A1]|uniref:Uncharacterized protein n=2 Tax=Phytophthora nicotianae TaxID=4792 RepID=W2JKA7_PHYNI|nr:hypothetical protein L915_04056 [Phytophthora nicotianae]ETL46023.1 hypothetical protein L916_04007 [Phytophthora nicotianae]ETP22573.1 hypothetical protein F441_04147 [Phytophthora nicotianae CJ01A1]